MVTSSGYAEIRGNGIGRARFEATRVEEMADIYETIDKGLDALRELGTADVEEQRVSKL